MEKKKLWIQIFLDNGLEMADVHMRYIFVDTIESRGLGEVVEEGTSADGLELIVTYPANENVQPSIVELLNSFRFTNYKMEELDDENDSVDE